MDPLASSPASTIPSSGTAASGTNAQTPSLSSQQAFQMALSAALNPPNVLGDAGGSDDDDDGSALTVKASMGL